MPVYVIAACVLLACRIFNNIILLIGLLLEMECYDSGDSNSQPYFTAALVCSRWVQLSAEKLTDPELGALDILGCRRANFKRAICIRAAAMAAQPLINHDGLQQTGQRT